MYIAVCHGHIDVIQIFLNNGADVSIKSDGSSVYHCAAGYGYLDILKLLVQHNDTFINDGDCHNYTPIYGAIEKNHVKVVHYLLSKNADVTVKTTTGDTVFHVAVLYANYEIMKAFVRCRL